MKKVIDLLKKANTKLFVSETGYGCEFSNKIMETSGASEVVYATESRYSKESQYFDGRSVSIGYCIDRIHKNFVAKPRSFEMIYIATSFQAGEDKNSHGYITTHYKGGVKTIHLDFGKNQNKFGVNILVHSYLIHNILSLLDPSYNKDTYSLNKFVDGVFDMMGNFLPKCMPKGHKPFVITRDGEWSSVNNFIRDKKEITLLKGSFNPVHKGHIELANSFPSETVFSMTTNSVQGKNVSIDELVIRALNLKWDAIIDSSLPWYEDLCSFLISYNSDLHFDIPLGSDVYNKLNIKDLNRFNCKFNVFMRNTEDKKVSFFASKYPDLSSTKIRNQNDPKEYL